MALRTIQANADQKGKPVFLHFQKPEQDKIKKDHINLDLNKIMQNIGGEAFAYGTFKNAYDSDPRVKNMINDFSEDSAEMKTQVSEPDVPPTDDQDDTVSKMAQNATDL